LRGEPNSLVARLDTAFAEDYQEFSFERVVEAARKHSARSEKSS
jgi:hypothetical protein